MKKCFGFILIIVLMSCSKPKSDEEHYAKLLTEYVNHFSKFLDRDISYFQKKLKLRSNQTEILYLMKGDLLAKIPELRELIFNIQMMIADSMSKDVVEYKDIRLIFDELNLYYSILRDPIIVRFIQLHDLMNEEQKAILAKYINSGRTQFYYAKTPPTGLFIKKFLQLNKDVKLDSHQILILFGYSSVVKKEYKVSKKAIKNEGLLLRNYVADIVLSEKIEIADVDKRIDESLGIFDGIQNVLIERTLLFMNSLSSEQKAAVISFIVSIDFI